MYLVFKIGLLIIDCVAYNGTRVAAGEMYAPESDPCKICTCDNGLPVRCMSVGCAVPPMPCEDPKPVPGVCCKFTCEERVAVSQLFGKSKFVTSLIIAYSFP